jgi:hypothetical protein
MEVVAVCSKSVEVRMAGINVNIAAYTRVVKVNVSLDLDVS